MRFEDDVPRVMDCNSGIGVPSSVEGFDNDAGNLNRLVYDPLDPRRSTHGGVGGISGETPPSLP